MQEGVLKLSTQNVTGARAAFEEILNANPGDLRALDILVQTYAGEAQVSAATEKIRYYAAQRQNSVSLQMFWANWLMTHGNNQEAGVALMAAKTADPAQTDADVALARLDFNNGNLKAAGERIAAVILANPRNVGARMVAGAVEQARNNHPKAVDHYLAVVQIDERNAVALNNLAYEMAQDVSRLDEALKYAQKAKELTPESSHAQDTLGWIYYRKGMYQMAARELEGALAKETIPAIQFHLGLTYKRLGDSQKGTQLVLAALAVRPDLADTESLR